MAATRLWLPQVRFHRPVQGLLQRIAGEAWVNWLFMLGLLAIGVALTFGVAIRLGAIAGFVMYVMMWSVALLPTTNPVLDDHISAP